MTNANASIARPVAVAKPGAKLLNPHDHTLIMIDFQSQMAFATHSIDPVQLRSTPPWSLRPPPASVPPPS
jgi:hypothetical protein